MPELRKRVIVVKKEDHERNCRYPAGLAEKGSQDKVEEDDASNDPDPGFGSSAPRHRDLVRLAN
jgi:hypothetical protein